MASSNRHWPSMFKSKPCNTHHHQWQQDISSSLMSSGGHRSPYSAAVPGCEERSPEPKPRWNPRPEQIRILEAIFNSGMVNPPRDEIRKIRAQLQEYGQVGDANVFYWFQNRKSRSKHKQRHLQNTKSQSQNNTIVTAPSTNTKIITALSSSSSSSEKSSPKSVSTAFSATSANVSDLLDSPNASVNQPYFQSHGDLLQEPSYFTMQQPYPTAAVAACGFTQGFSFPELSNAAHIPVQNVGASCTGLILNDLLMNHDPSSKDVDEKLKLQQQLIYTVTTAPISTHSIVPPVTVTVPSNINHIQGAGAAVAEPGGVGPERSTVFINDVAFDVPVGPFNVKESFGDNAVLVHFSGQPVLTNQWGVTLHSLQHGAFYYLVHSLPPSDDNHLDLV